MLNNIKRPINRKNDLVNFVPLKIKPMHTIVLFMPSGQELIIIAVIILLLFGGRKIPELMRGLGKGVKEFKSASDGAEDVKKEIDDVSSDLKKSPPDKKSDQEKDENRDENKRDDPKDKSK